MGKSNPHKKPVGKPRTEWYQSGLNFECQNGCCKCCICGTGMYVFLSELEIVDIAHELGIDPVLFRNVFTRPYGGGRALTSTSVGECVLLDVTTGKCGVYNARPTQCRTYPFWTEVVHSKSAWKQEMKRCPGIGKGDKFFFPDFIKKQCRIAGNALPPEVLESREDEGYEPPV